MMMMDAGVDSGVPMPTMITATGSLTGTITAPKPTVGYDTTTGSFALKKKVTGDPYSVDIYMEFGAAPSVATFDSTSAAFKCDVTVGSGPTPANTWVARFMSVAGADKGTCSVTFTSATMGASGYDVAGNFAISADNSGGASTGTVSLMGTF